VTSATAPWNALTSVSTFAAARTLAAVDSTVERLAGRPVRVRAGLDGSLLRGHVARLHLSMRDISFAGLSVAELHARAGHVALHLGNPPRLQARDVRVTVRVDQADIDRWVEATRVPMRLRLRNGTLRARLGIAGLRLSETRVHLRVERGQLQLVPDGLNVLGVDLRTPIAPITLPLPGLPRQVRLERAAVGDGSLWLALAVESFDEPLAAATVRQLLLVRRSIIVGPPAVGPRSARSRPTIGHRSRRAGHRR
jgi:hypothetical protein